ncbi:MAG: hypothetical protein JXP72_08305 [Coriobacteriia bacterium]|nr:hypothetical protein [Coriobacteriia bacterium]
MTRHTRTRTALIATIALVMTLIAAVPAFAAGADLHRVGVTVYDLEGGKTPTLVIFASLAEEVTLPATVELPIPADVTLGWVGEVFPDPSLDTIAEYTLREEAGYDVLVITVNSSRAVQAELTVPDAWLIAGGQYLGIAMSWTANQDLAGVRLGFEVPDSFHAEELQPASASGARSSVGVLYSAETTPVAEGDTLTLSATVVPGADPDLAPRTEDGAVATEAPVPGVPDAGSRSIADYVVPVLGALVGVLLVVLVVLVIRSRKPAA